MSYGVWMAAATLKRSEERRRKWEKIKKNKVFVNHTISWPRYISNTNMIFILAESN